MKYPSGNQGPVIIKPGTMRKDKAENFNSNTNTNVSNSNNSNDKLTLF